MLKSRVFVNCFASVCCASEDSEGLFEAICSHQSGIRAYDCYVEDKFVALGKIQKSFNIEDILYSTCRDVLKQSGLENFEDTLLVVGSSVGGMQNSEEIFLKEHHYKNINPELHNINAIAYILKEKFVFKDDISFSTACTSSANALGYGYEVISKGVYKNVLVVGFDTLSQTTIHGFSSLGVLSSSTCKPFDKQRDGMNVAEGIAVVLLQSRQKEQSIEFFGVGYSSDAYHMTHPSPDGQGAKMAMRRALQSANINADDIDYINAHGTGTPANDSSESCAIDSLFPHKPFVSSTKSITGHTLGAAGALEAIVCVLALQKQIIPPNTNLEAPENEMLNYVYEAKKKELRYVLSNSLAFGGNNTALIFGLPR
ncbi:MAG: beta-ketoacyl-[acyl-carrier-protein] synthase family protein [Sulfurospirillaceae bacterium]|nr:beta-ketoacyl-[acyl-carrier-protein] synthase family protein [Sulfurospirillaceae bacterium]